MLLHGIESTFGERPTCRTCHIRPFAESRRREAGHNTKIYERTLEKLVRPRSRLRFVIPPDAVITWTPSSIVGRMTRHSYEDRRGQVNLSRRQLLGGGLAGASILLGSCTGRSATATTPAPTSSTTTASRRQ